MTECLAGCTLEAADHSGCCAHRWDTLLALPHLPPTTLRWMIDQATGWLDFGFAPRGWLYLTLLQQRADLTEEELLLLTGCDGVPDLPAAQALLGHPNSTLAVTCALAGSVMNEWGGSRSSGWQRDVHLSITTMLCTRGDARTRAVFNLRGHGLSSWHHSWHDVSGLAAGAGQAQRLFSEAVTSFDDAAGGTGWDVVNRLLDGGRLRGAEVLLAATAILAPPRPRQPT